MGRNIFSVNTSSVNAINQIGVPVVYPVAAVVSAGWRALRHEEMIQRAKVTGSIKILATGMSFTVPVAIKRLKVVTGSTPLRHKVRVGYVSPVALARVGFTGTLRTGDTIRTGREIYHIEEAHLQEESGESLRWVLDLDESGTI